MYSCYIGVRIPKISVLKADFKLFVPLYFISIVNMKMAENLAIIVAYKVSRKNSTQLITSTFKMAWAQRNPETKLIFHSDRGAQYTSHRFKQLLHEHAVVQSFSNSGRPHDNAVAESFFATLKKEELYRKDYTSETDFKRCLASYIEFYNTQRPHRTLKNRTPCQVEELFMNGK